MSFPGEDTTMRCLETAEDLLRRCPESIHALPLNQHPAGDDFVRVKRLILKDTDVRYLMVYNEEYG